MSKQSATNFWMPAAWMAAIVIAAVGAIAGSSHLHVQHKSTLSSSSQAVSASATESGRLRANLDALPLAFEANQGQADPRVKYMARGNGYTAFLTENEIVFAVSSPAQASAVAKAEFMGASHPTVRPTKQITAAIHMKPVGANPKSQIVAGQALPGHTNYFIGNDRTKWQTGVKHYAAVKYDEVYPGVDMVFHGQQRQLEFDFVLAPGADTTPIRLDVRGAKQIKTDATGDLILTSTAGDVVLHKPIAYQGRDKARQIVDAAFVVQANSEVSFKLGSYDHSRQLVIDPSINYATYLGGNGEDEVFGITSDASKNIYVSGESMSTSGFPGGNVSATNGFDAFVTKLTPTGTLTYTTFIGGSAIDTGLAIAADSAGNAYVTGITESANFPADATAPQPSQTGLGTNCTNKKVANNPCSDAFAAKLDSAGVKSWATFIGGSNDDHGFGIALDGNGNVWVAGDTFSSDFYPVLLSHATKVGSSTFNLGVVQAPSALTDDGFLVEINPAGTAPFLYATYHGGSSGDEIDAVATDASNNVYVAGQTFSPDFPTTTGAYKRTCGSDGNCNASSGNIYSDAFVSKFANGSYSVGGYSTYIGGSYNDAAFAIAINASGDAYITGQTAKNSFTPVVLYPTTSGAFSTTYNSAANSNAIVTELKADGSGLVYSTFLGGGTQDFGGSIALDTSGNAYVTGQTYSSDFPVTPNAYQSKLNGDGTNTHSDAFVTEIMAGGATLGLSTFLGGSGDENANASGAAGAITRDASGNVWVGGSTNSANGTTNFPVTSGALETTYGGNPYDGFVVEMSPGFGVSATAPASVAPGTSATSTVTLTSIFGYSSAVNLSCSVTGGGSPAPSCSTSGAFSKNPVTPTIAGAPSTLTITTTGSAAAAIHRSRGIFYATWLPVIGFSLIGMCFTATKSPKKKLLGFLLLGSVMAMLFFLPACSSSTTTVGTTCKGCTPAGNYTVTITGKDSNSLSQSTQVTLTVQ